VGIFKNIFSSKKSTVAPVVNVAAQPVVRPTQAPPYTPPVEICNPKYVELDRKVKEGSYQERMDVIKTLEGDRDKKAIEILTWIMHNGNSHSGEVTMFDERAIAAGTLGKTGGEQALHALEGAIGLSGLETDIKYAIIEIRKNQGAEELVEGLRSSPVSTLAILLERKDSAGAEKALSLLDSRDITTVVSAARYLGVIQYEPAVDKLIETLQSQYIDKQHSAAVALGRIGGEKAKFALLDALHHKSEWAISGAIKGLAIMWGNGEKDVKEKVAEINWKEYVRNICSKDDGVEQAFHDVAVRKMFE